MLKNNDLEHSTKSDVVILAGGFGTRLIDEIGSEIPKCLAKINDKPLLQSQLELCKRHNFKNILILLHHLSEKVIDFVGDGSKFGLKVRYSIENEPRGTAGAVTDILNLLSDKFIVIYGDTYLDVDLKKFYDSFDESCSMLTFCHPNSHPHDSDLLVLDDSDRVIDVFRPNKSSKNYYNNIVNAALYISKKDAFKKVVPKSGMMDISSEMFPQMIKKGMPIKAYKSVEYIKDMGTPNRYQLVQSDIKNKIPNLLSSQIKRKCVFLDRDGVINREVGHLNDINKFELINDSARAIKLLNSFGYLVICVTNQPVIARGDLSFSGLRKIHMKMEACLGDEGAYIDDIFICPHHPENGFKNEIKALKITCNCRKPAPGMILSAIEKHNIDPAKSWLVGDHERDIIAGNAANVKTILVTNDFDYHETDSIACLKKAYNLYEAAKLIIDSDKVKYLT